MEYRWECLRCKETGYSTLKCIQCPICESFNILNDLIIKKEKKLKHDK